MGTLKEQQAQLRAKGIETLGYVTWWSISTKDIPKSSVDPWCRANGIRPLEKRPRSSFKKALDELHRGTKLITKKIRDDVTSIIYVIADSEAREKQLKLSKQSWVEFDKISNTITTSQDEGTDAFEERYIHFMTHYDSTDIRGIVEKTMLSAGLIPLRSAGGVYFVNVKRMEPLEKVAAFLQAFSSGAITRISIFDADDISKKGVADDFQANGKSVTDRIIERLEATPDDTEYAAKAIREILDLERDARSLEAVLRFKADIVHDQIARVRNLIKSV